MFSFVIVLGILQAELYVKVSSLHDLKIIEICSVLFVSNNTEFKQHNNDQKSASNGKVTLRITSYLHKNA